MPSIFSALNSAVVSSLNVVTRVATAVENTVEIGTDYIDHASIHYRSTGKESWTLATTLEMEKIQAELDGNVKRQTLFDQVAKLYDKK